jgi:hypothetical protein
MNTRSVAQLVLLYIDDSHDGRRLDALIDGAQRACREMTQRGYRRWYVMYSGGKDSTAALVLTLEALKDTDASVEVLYCDTSSLRSFWVFLPRRASRRLFSRPTPKIRSGFRLSERAIQCPTTGSVGVRSV